MPRISAALRPSSNKLGAKPKPTFFFISASCAVNDCTLFGGIKPESNLLCISTASLFALADLPVSYSPATSGPPNANAIPLASFPIPLVCLRNSFSNSSVVAVAISNE